MDVRLLAIFLKLPLTLTDKWRTFFLVTSCHKSSQLIVVRKRYANCATVNFKLLSLDHCIQPIRFMGIVSFSHFMMNYHWTFHLSFNSLWNQIKEDKDTKYWCFATVTKNTNFPLKQSTKKFRLLSLWLFGVMYRCRSDFDNDALSLWSAVCIFLYSTIFIRNFLSLRIFL